ncbi:MAG: hypothetical protein ACM3QU_03230 [Verrucomicrobiota bacterium]
MRAGTHLLGHHAELPADVVLSIQEVSKKAPAPPPQPPRWLARFLPGVQWSAAGDYDDDGDDDGDGEDDLDEEPDIPSRLSALKALSFDVQAGSALGLVGPDAGARRALLWMIAGFVPPATGRILVRGHVAPLFNAAEINVTRQNGERAVKLTATFFHWPWDLIQSRWDEILEFARIHEITRWPQDSLEYEAHRTKRLLLSTAMHMDAALYLISGNFYAIEPEFVARCHALLEERLQEGCAVIHSIGDPQHLARYCHEAMYIENGRVRYRGRLGEVARFAHERPAGPEPGAARLPVRAVLVGEEPVNLDGGGSVELELDVFARRVDLELGMLLVDEAGNRVRIEAPERFTVHKPGIYRLSVGFPAGVIHRATYAAQLVASAEDDVLDEEGEAHTLMSFELEVPEGPEPSGEVERVVDEVEWTVREQTEVAS